MKILILKEARIHVRPGDVVEASPADAGFLISTGSARAITEDGPETADRQGVETPERKTARTRKK